MQLFLEVAVLRKHGGAGSGQPPRGGGVQCARGSAGPPPPPRPSSPGRVPHARRPGSAARGRLPVAAASSGQLAGRGGGRGHPAARPEPCKFAGPGACARECECVPGGGGRNKEPSKHGESVSSKAHKYSSRVLISPTHTHTRARARAATPPGLRPPSRCSPKQLSPKLLSQTVQHCTRGVGAEGVGVHTHTHTHTQPGKRTQGALSRDPRPADPAREREDTGFGSQAPPIPQTVLDCTKRRGAAQRGSPKGSPFMYTLPRSLGQQA